ncbi:MAG: DUF5916 domain-containing protein [Hyphomicrobiales bacterium]
MTRFHRWIVTAIALAASLGTGAAGALAFAGFAPDGSGPAYPDSANGRATAMPTIRAHELGRQEIKVDGRLDDPAWQDAPAARGFRQWNPDRDAPAAEQTVFKVAYDDAAIYFGIACLEDDPSHITATLSRRDHFTNSDIVAVYIDPYHDHTTGYAFKVNPLGVQLDSYIYNDGANDDDWDAVWEAETSRDDKGWYAEIRIPFSAIRYRGAEDMTWGLDVWRYMQGRGQDTAWHTWPREQNGFVSQFGELTGIRGVHAPRKVELLPYVVQRETDHAMTGTPSNPDRLDGFQDFGADLKYGLTSDLTLNATVQPDFGQVEADPAVLNLSPYETFYDEKRPFFIEGSRFFQALDFNLFYSRRIGTGSELSRIRYAAKVTGKTVGGVSVAALAASTDLTQKGQAHNFFKSGDRLTRYLVGKFGKEFSQGRNRFAVMQTAVLNTADRSTWGDRASRNAYTSEFEFDLNSPKRSWNFNASTIASVIDPDTLTADPTITGKRKYGTGGNFNLNRRGGKWRGSIGGRWETGKLDINDLGYLQAPDEMLATLWVQRQLIPDGKSKVLNQGNLNVNFSRSWMYAGRTGYDITTGQPAWHYEPGHPQYLNSNVNGWFQFRNYREAQFGVVVNGTGHHRWETRGGPIIDEPFTYGGWVGASSDTRKDLTASLETDYYRDTAQNVSFDATLNGTWKQSTAVTHQVSLAFHDRWDDTQYLETVDLTQRPGGIGIGGLSYVFGDIHQKTVDVTLRSSLLFSRNQSLEIYAQPFLTVGDYSRVRELARPDSYDLVPYLEPGYDVRNNDFSYSSVNLNMVYRWEYRPGSTFYLVWTQSRSRYDDRGQFAANPSAFRNDLRPGPLFRNEPENTILAKITYWIPL